MYENHDKKITDKIFIKVAGLIQRYVKISWLFSLNRLSLLRVSHKTLSQSAHWFLLWVYIGLPYSIWRVVKRWLKISLQELFVCKYLWPALAPLLSNPGKLMNREHRSTARGGHVSLCILGILNLELPLFCFFPESRAKRNWNWQSPWKWRLLFSSSFILWNKTAK